MSTRIMIKFSKRLNSSLIINGTKERCLLPSIVSASYLLRDNHIHSLPLSRNLELISNEKITDKLDFKVLRPNESQRPLTLLYSWMMAKESHVMKYAKLYTDRDIDVLKVRISPLDLLRPTRGAQIAAHYVLKFLQSNPSYNPLLVHGFSVGAYTFCESMYQAHNNMEKYGHILKRFVGQIWDSAVDIDGIPSGLPRALTDNVVIQNQLEKYLRFYMRVNMNTATIHYQQSSRMMHENRVGVPGLFIFSKKDLVSTPEMNAKVYRKWEQKGYPVFTKCFESSSHVSHFHKYRKDYEDEMNAFLETAGMIHPTKNRAVVG